MQAEEDVIVQEQQGLIAILDALGAANYSKRRNKAVSEVSRLGPASPFVMNGTHASWARGKPIGRSRVSNDGSRLFLRACILCSQPIVF